MLKKSDLTKQFELVVQQEIKNYQDSLNFVLQSIKELKDSIEQVRSETLENYAMIHSQQGSLESRLENLLQDNFKNKQKIYSHINDFEVFKKKATDEIGMHGDLSMHNSRQHEFNKNRLEETNGRLETVEDEMRGHSLIISTTFENLKFKLSKDLSRMKEEILSQPSKSDEVRKELADKITSHQVDVEGILKEIRINRKDMTIIQKKIENIYTLIERLKNHGGDA